MVTKSFKCIHFVRTSCLIVVFSLLLACSLFAQDPTVHQDQEAICAVYLTGIGCPSCAKVDPVLFVEMTASYPNLIIFEYEIYRSRENNNPTKESYYEHYWGPEHRGIPFFILNVTEKAMGSFKILELLEKFADVNANHCPMPDGQLVEFSKVDLTQLPGKISIWTKNRVLITEQAEGNNRILHKLLQEVDVRKALHGVDYQVIEPFPVTISQSEIMFEHAVRIGTWTLLWNGQQPQLSKDISYFFQKHIHWFFIFLMALLLLCSFCRFEKTSRGLEVKLRDIHKKKFDYVAIVAAVVFLSLFFVFAKNMTPDFLENMGYDMPLGVFTFFIALVDGFNPCNMFVLTCLMALLISTSDSKVRLYIVGLSFVSMVFVIYFLFMAAWLNAFQYIGLITPLRIGIAVLAIVVGIINCKELLFFKKGISLTIPDQQRGPLMKKIYSMKKIIQNGSYPVLVLSSVALAALSSLIELPCTAGFPIIYTGILSARVAGSSLMHYSYLVYYNLIYVMPLVVIISVFILAFKGQPISQRQLEILKFVSGIIMLILGVLLLANPQLIGLSLG